MIRTRYPAEPPGQHIQQQPPDDCPSKRGKPKDVPDHATIARFRPGCQEAFAGLFVHMLLVAGKAGLARFGTVAIDGTKTGANASVRHNRGREWLASGGQDACRGGTG